MWGESTDPDGSWGSSAPADASYGDESNDLLLFDAAAWDAANNPELAVEPVVAPVITVVQTPGGPF